MEPSNMLGASAPAPLNPVPEAINSLRPVVTDRLRHLNAMAEGLICKVRDGGLTDGPTEKEVATRPSNGPGYAAQLMDIRSDLVEGLDSLETRLTLLSEYL